MPFFASRNHLHSLMQVRVKRVNAGGAPIPTIAVIPTSVLPYGHYRFLHFTRVTNITSDCTTIMPLDFFLCTSLSNQHQSPCNSFPLLYNVLTLIQRLYRSDAYISEHGRNTPTLQCLHRHTQVDQHGLQQINS